MGPMYILAVTSPIFLSALQMCLILVGLEISGLSTANLSVCQEVVQKEAGSQQCRMVSGVTIRKG